MIKNEQRGAAFLYLAPGGYFTEGELLQIHTTSRSVTQQRLDQGDAEVIHEQTGPERTHTRARAHPHTHTHMHTHAHKNTHTRTLTKTHTHAHKNTHVNTRTLTHACSHARTTHTHSHTLAAKMNLQEIM